MKIKIKKKVFLINSPNIIEDFLDSVAEDDDLNEDKIPYWSELWPSSLMLGKFILTHPHIFREKRCLDLGCGLGLVSMALKLSQAIVYSQDIMFESLVFLKNNFSKNKIPYPVCIQGDWRYPCFKKNSLDIIVASDVLYERRFHVPILTFINYTLKQSGAVYITTPKREGAWDFFKKATSYNLTSYLIKKNSIYLNKITTQIYLWKFIPTNVLSLS